MKTLISSYGLCLWVIISLCTSCSGPIVSEEAELAQTSTPEALEAPAVAYKTKIGELLIPDNTSIEVAESQTEVKFTFPEGVYFVEDQGGNIPSTFKEVIYVCDCHGPGPGGCTVIYYNNSFGCLQGRCSGLCTGYLRDENGSSNLNVAGGFIDLNQEVEFIDSRMDVSGLMEFHPVLLKLPEVQEALGRIKPVSSDIPSKIVGLNLFGNIVGVQVPVSEIEKNPSAYREVSCKCRVGDGCKLQQQPETCIWLCVGERCIQCAMIVKDENGGSH